MKPFCYLGIDNEKLEDGLKDLIAESIEETKFNSAASGFYKFLIGRETAWLLIAGTNVILLGQGNYNYLKRQNLCFH